MLTPKQVFAALEAERRSCNACDYHVSKLIQLDNFIAEVRTTKSRVHHVEHAAKVVTLLNAQYEEREELINSGRAHLLNDTHPTAAQIEQEEG